MPPLVWTEQALEDVRRMRQFLYTQNPQAARRAVARIRAGVKVLTKHPEIGRVVFKNRLREWVIPFGQRGYLVLYEVNAAGVLLLAVRHNREDGYKSIEPA